MSIVAMTGNQSIDGVLWGVKWDLAEITYAFPTRVSDYQKYDGIRGFETFNATQRTAVDSIIAGFNDLVTMVVSKASDPSTGNLRFAEATSVDDGPGGFTAVGTAFGNPPDENAGPRQSQGDIFFNPQDYNNPVKGSYAFVTLIHEMGHALGLKHGHAKQLSPDGAFTIPKLPAAEDSMEFSVMTYRSAIGGSTTAGYPNEKWGYAQSYMMNDIAALQYLYGADYTTHSGDTVYKWKPNTGEMFIDGVGQGTPGGNRIFLTIWDGGGDDTYDFSTYATSLQVDLAPGGWSVLSDEQRAVLDTGKNIKARGNVFNALLHDNDTRSLIENAVGGSGDDTIFGNDGANTLTGNGGGDTLAGRRGTDTLIGSSGADRLSGGKGADTFWLTSSADGGDTVTDFDGKDLIALSASAFGNLGITSGHASALDDAFFISRNSNVAQSTDEHVIFRTGDSSLWFDVDGQGGTAAILLATLANGAVLSAGDIFIV